jgi:hypothetical protein
MNELKQSVSDAVAASELGTALAKLREAATACSAPPDLLKEITLLEQRHANNRSQARKGTQEHKEIVREDNSIADAVLDLLGQLPETAPVPPAKPRGIAEQTLKLHILLLVMGVKLAVLAWLFTQWEAGGFSADQFTGTLTLLLPVLAAYAGTMFQDFLEHRHHAGAGAAAGPRVRRSVQWAVYAVILGYGLALWAAIGAKARGTLSYAQLASALALVESGLGVYLARIVRAFFQSKG